VGSYQKWILGQLGEIGGRGRKLPPLKMEGLGICSEGMDRRNWGKGPKTKKPLQNGRALRF